MIFDAFERMVAFRYLRARRQEGFISLIAIFSFLGTMLGVAALIVTLSVMNGLTSDLLGRILGFGGHVTVSDATGNLSGFDAMAKRLASLPGIVGVRPVVDGQVLATARGYAVGATVRGLRREDLAHSGFAKTIPAEMLEQFTDDGVLVGNRLAYSLGLRPGDQITLTTPNLSGNSLVMPRARSYTIIGYLDTGNPDYDQSFILMPLAAAQDYFKTNGGVTGLELFVADPYKVKSYEGAIAQAAGADVQLVDWQEANAALFGALRVERTVMFIILSLVVLVAAFNIVCSMTMLVKDKGRDIAILRTMGASRATVLRIFVLSGASIGVVGTIAGFVLGVLCAANVEGIQRLTEWLFGDGTVAASLAFFTQVPPRIDPTEIIVILIMALALSFLATIYPSWRAARLDPVEALRYE
jgi:lipoprotein-releasing system permease protein